MRKGEVPQSLKILNRREREDREENPQSPSENGGKTAEKRLMRAAPAPVRRRARVGNRFQFGIVLQQVSEAFTRCPVSMCFSCRPLAPALALAAAPGSLGVVRRATVWKWQGPILLRYPNQPENHSIHVG